MISRRAFLRGAAFTGTIGCVGAAYADISYGFETGDLRREFVSVQLPRLAPEFDGYKIGFLTDPHLGIWIPEAWISRALEIVTADDVDLVVLGGDYICVNDNPIWEMFGAVRNPAFFGLKGKEEIAAIFSAFERLVRPHSFRDGIVAVAGNHEHWNSTRLFHDIIGRSPAIRVLVNEEVELRRGSSKLLLYGTDDFLTGVPRAPRKREQHEAARVVVTHSPDFASFMLSSNRADFELSLSGHTHGGQIRAPIIGALAQQVSDSRFVAGLHEVDGRLIYTSRGLGVVGIPFRINCPPEVTVVQLRQAR